MRLLLSYFYYQRVDLDDYLARFPERPDVFADSGAFTAYTQGAPVLLDEYAAWLRRNQHHFTTMANLDVIGDYHGTQANQKRLEDAGLPVLPVFHANAGFAWDRLAALCERYEYIALGGLVEWGDTLPWCIRAFKEAQPYGTRFHGFGQTSTDTLRDLPWYSVDSSSWGSVYRYGSLSLWDEQACRWVKVVLRNRAHVRQHYDLIRRYGEDGAFLLAAGDKRDPGRVPRVERARLARLSALAWQGYERYLQRRHHVAPPRGYDEQGTRVYLAAEARFTNGTLDGLTGTRIYLADGHPENLLMGAGASIGRDHDQTTHRNDRRAAAVGSPTGD